MNEVVVGHGSHVVADCFDCNKTLITQFEDFKKSLNEVCDLYEITVLNRFIHVFSNNSFTVLYALAESHISIHTWPETNYIAMDVYTCGKMNPHDVFLSIVELFECTKYKCVVTSRGREE